MVFSGFLNHQQYHKYHSITSQQKVCQLRLASEPFKIHRHQFTQKAPLDIQGCTETEKIFRDPPNPTEKKTPRSPQFWYDWKILGPPFFLAARVVGFQDPTTRLLNASDSFQIPIRSVWWQTCVTNLAPKNHWVAKGPNKPQKKNSKYSPDEVHVSIT